MGFGLGLAIGGALQGAGDAMMKDVLMRRQYALELLKRQAPDLSTKAKELVEAGYKPGTQEFQDQMRGRINTDDTKIIPVTAQGSVFTMAPGQTSPEPAVMQNDGNHKMGDPVGRSSGGGNIAQPRSQQDYESLPSGASYMAPDGTIRTKGGPTQPASGSFRGIPSGNPLDPNLGR